MEKKFIRMIPITLAIVIVSGMQLDASGNLSFGGSTYQKNETLAFTDIVDSNKQTMYLTSDTNILSDESSVSSTIETAGKGTQVQLLSANGEICKVLTPSGKIGYVNVSKLTTSSQDIFQTVDEIKYASGDIEVKQLPSNESSTITTLSAETPIQIIGTNEYDFYQVSIDGTTGYICKENVKDEATPLVVTTTFESSGTGLTQASGVNFYNGRRETYYSSNVLYHYRTAEWTLDEEGFYREGEYYVVAASDMAQGTTFECSKGTCIVLDSGCAAGTTDYYVAW